MLKYFLFLTVLTAAPLGCFFYWRSTLPTEEQVLDRHRVEVHARLASFPALLATLPPPGAVNANTLPARLDPPPACDSKSGECNLQIATTYMLEHPEKYAAADTVLARYGPGNMSDVLIYVISRTLKPNEVRSEKVWGFADLIERGMQARYLLVNRHLNQQTPRGIETVGVEGFLIDLHGDKLLGSFRYPEWYNKTERQPAEVNRFLTDTLKGTISPEFRPMENVRTRDVERVTIVAIAYTGLMVVLWIASIPVALMLHRQHLHLAELREDGLYPRVLTCPVCDQDTRSLKRYRILSHALFVVVFATGAMDHRTACPSCMRRIIRRRFFLNLLPGNVMMLVFGPALLFQYLRTFWRGHSPDAVEQAEES